ncbi:MULTISPECIES: cytochrome c [Rhizobium]|uniref:Gluconate 2-dehydrogenase (Acceptor) n=1 Tax=Rhizobium favelukesii TaxID=348824 RepID=W6RR01_9HYPH|nr:MULTISPECIES: cytochrome c [Rhizobium]MCA0805566.1 cytochrome c [Rhizobium sp. T1473]MCS0462949.1 cytochrome c [Rhizobium favelukesii]UFS79088.1 cytochrome c [Rhizobium sp. T136]CDM62585.1 Gluconate 2-dehydrogenase (acceptor) [Rhizobium favelukesii]
MMLRRVLAVTAVVAGIGVLTAICFFFWPHRLPTVLATASQPQGEDLIARGKYLVTASDCEACHTAPGGKPFAGGLAFKLPFGTIFSPNLTPDMQAGLGSWSDAEFVRAMRSGVGKHGEDLYPAFPYTSYALMSTDDILAVKAYLGTLQPQRNPSLPAQLSFPFNQRWLMRGWKLLFVPWHPFERDANKDDRWNKGAYLVEALAHCGECHTPRGLMFEKEQARALSGGDVDGWKAWNITSDRENGIGGWSDQDLVAYLSKGYVHRHGPASGSMRQAIDLSLSRLPKSDIEAIVSYLRTVRSLPSSYPKVTVNNLVPAIQSAQAWSPGLNKQDGLGLRIFEGACASCHGFDGSGQNAPWASLAGSHSVNDPAGSNLIRLILQGSSDSTHNPTTTMPNFAAAYSDAEIAAVANYVINHFAGRNGKVTPSDVAKAR